MQTKRNRDIRPQASIFLDCPVHLEDQNATETNGVTANFSM